MSKVKKETSTASRVVLVITPELREAFEAEAVEKHAGNMSFLFRKILNKRYKMDSHPERWGK